jgi:Tol biopolymer transport system component
MKKVFIVTAVILVIIVLFFAFLSSCRIASFPIISNLRDSMTEKSWTHEEILNGERGNIFTLGDDHKLIGFNTETKQWETVNSRSIRPERWAMCPKLIVALQDSSDISSSAKTGIFVYAADTGAMLKRISLDEPPYEVVNLSLDQNGKYLAIVSQGNRLSIISLDDGRMVYESDKLSSWAPIDWSADSSRIIFSAFKKNDLRGNIGQTPSIYVLDLTTGKSEKVCDGWAPKWDSSGDKILYCQKEWCWRNGDLYLLDRKTNSKKLLVSNARLVDYSFSPTGKNAVVSILQNVFSMYHWPKYLTIVNCDNPELKYIIKSGVTEDERFYWINN